MLFSPSEKRASQLTQYYQLTVPDLATAKETDLVGSDIDSWFSRRQYAGLYSALEGKFTRWTSLFEGGLRDLVPLATIHPLLTRCMNAAADHTQPSREDQIGLDDLIKTHLDPPVIIWDKGEGVSVQHGRSANKEAVVGLLLSEFVMAIGDKSFTRCEVCGSVFPQSRRGMKYCSDRCLNRFQVQQFRSRKKRDSSNALIT